MLAAVSLCAGSMTTLFLQTALQSNKDENEPQNSSSKGSARMLIAEDLEIAEDFEPSTGGAILSGVSSTWTTTTRSPPPPNQESFPGFPKCWGNPELVSECDESIDYQWSIVPDELYIPGEKADGEWWPDYELPRFDKIRILYYTKRTGKSEESDLQGERRIK